jgi:hypothetical protein
MTNRTFVVVALAATAAPALAQNALVLTGGSRKTSCRAAISAPGLEFPAGKRARGATCADGGRCDADGLINGVCQIAVQVCVNVPEERCPTTEVRQVRLKATGPASKDAAVVAALTALEAAAAAIPLPSSTFGCSATVNVPVAVKGPDKRGRLKEGTVKMKVTVKPKAKGKVALVCRPGGDSPPATTTTTTLPPAPSGSPEEGLRAEILGAEVDASRRVHVTVQLTDDAGFPVTPVLGSTDDPDEARLRLTIARIDLDSSTQEGLTTTFSRYRNYITSPQTSPITAVTADLPTYDSGGTLAPVDPATGTWRYTFKNPLPEGYDASLTHTVGGQAERAVGETTLVANPLFDFVPAGGAVTTVREVVTTAQCNSCHNPLEAHGGGRREVKLCQLCHTDQAADPDTGSSIALLDMIHRIHRGRDLPSITAESSPVGTRYEIVGFQQSHHVFGEKIQACAGGAFNGITCGSDADCGSAGTCTGTTTVGVSFPRDLRACETCHGGATAADYAEKPSTAACASCHDDVNPGQTPTGAGAPGTNHVAGDQPETLCRICHTPTGTEFDISVPGAHTMPLRSTGAPQLAAELRSAAGAASDPITVTFRLTDGAGTALMSLEGLDTVRFNASGPTTDFGATTPPIVSGTAQASSGETGVLTGPDGEGVFTYVFGTLPAGATGTWRIGIEARTASVTAPNGESVRAAAQNEVLDFSVDGTAVMARRTITSNEKCAACHGTFSVDFSIHGGLRNNVEYCGICHHPRATDFSSRNTQIAAGADPDSESIHLKVLLHKLHTGEDLDQTLYIVYGRQGRPIDLGEVRFPGDRRDCATCHENDSNLLPLPGGLLPTRFTTNVGGSEMLVEDRPPVTAACTTCHGSESALSHARANTFGGTETCQVCHGEGRVVAVSEVHARAE